MPSVAQLKASLKEIAMSQSGDKGTLEWRLKTYRKCTSMSLKTWDGSNPCTLNAAKLRTACAKAGVSCIGNNDENLELLVQHLENNAPSSAGDTTATTATQSSGGASSKVNAVQVIKRILELDELDEHASILNIAIKPGDSSITSQTPTGLIRKAYLKLSVMIHPDRCKHSDATKAFQALVKAFDRVSSPAVYADDESSGGNGGSNMKTLARSNQGCKRTRLCCPRCEEPWSERKMEGNPEYYYNFMMMGLKQFHCSTCLCLFGCMSAIHLCPFCKRQFEYSPSDYHRQIVCGHGDCNGKPFGFYMFNTR